MHQSNIVFIICALLFVGSVNSEPSSSVKSDEVQLLIDVSGSMKQNDPQNLRIDATQLLINLLADKSKASLWLFAEKTSLLTQSNAVDEKWRKEALQASRSIHSGGLYTNIENAIQTTLTEGFAGNGNKNLILLTDGMVDISKDIMVSADSRERILSEWLPKLRQRAIKIQTIALSDQADRELLEQLAYETGGWHETTATADQLQRLFLKIADKVAPKDALPIIDNQFKIDTSIKEFSVLVFKNKDANPTQLIAPNQQIINKKTDSKTVAWIEDSGYDLITVKQPLAGDWKIEAGFDPDNKVMILTDLKFQMDEQSNFVAEKQALTVNVHFTNQGQLIDRPEFLNLVNIFLVMDAEPPIAVPANSKQLGSFSYTVNELNKGKHHLQIVADGKTFKREINKDIEVVSTLISLEKQVDNVNRQLTLKFLPDRATLDSSALAINASIEYTNKAVETRVVAEKDGEWLLPVDAILPGDKVLINFNVMAKTLQGEPVTPWLAPVVIDDSSFAASEPIQQKVEPDKPAADTSQSVKVDENQPPAETPEDQPEAKTDSADDHWGMTIGVVLGINLVLCVIAYFVYRALKQANIKKQQQLLERLA